jgi:hypothetical protein
MPVDTECDFCGNWRSEGEDSRLVLEGHPMCEMKFERWTSREPDTEPIFTSMTGGASTLRLHFDDGGCQTCGLHIDDGGFTTRCTSVSVLTDEP